VALAAEEDSLGMRELYASKPNGLRYLNPWKARAPPGKGFLQAHFP
jgi:hypothetical protein